MKSTFKQNKKYQCFSTVILKIRALSFAPFRSELLQNGLLFSSALQCPGYSFLWEPLR